MDALLATFAAVVLIGLALTILARGWPRSYGRAGYRVWSRGGRPDGQAQAEERGEAEREEDDAPWRWDRRDDDGGGTGTSSR